MQTVTDCLSQQKIFIVYAPSFVYFEAIRPSSMNILSNLTRLLLAFFCSLPIQAISQPDTSFFFVQLADPQFGMYPMQKDFQKERKNLTQAVRAINRLRPDFVVICGDLTNRASSAKQIKAFREILASVDNSIPVYLVPGNHDVGNDPTESSIQRYRGEFGEDYYTFKRHGQRFIVLNSSVIKSPARVPNIADAQLKWLKTVLDSASAEHSHPIVFQHHPWFVVTPRERNGYFNIPRTIRKGYLSLLESHGVHYVFAGHLHANAHGTYRSLKMITSGPVGMPLGRVLRDCVL